MKDFYYILGLQPTASAEDIKKAYRKLSQKFHPDKNNGDAFFAERFQEVKEAYETLIEPARRTIYDHGRKGGFAAKTTVRSNGAAPFIEYFKASKTSFVSGDVVTFYWRTANASTVLIRPFGQVSPSGEKTYRLRDYKNPALTFELVAESSANGKQAKVTLTLANETYQELYQFFRKKIMEEKSGGRLYNRQNTRTIPRPRTRREANEKMYLATRPLFLVIAIVVVLLLVLVFALES